jgi:hypothetical protein
MTDRQLDKCACAGTRFSASCTAVPDAEDGLCAFCAEWCRGDPGLDAWEPSTTGDVLKESKP